MYEAEVNRKTESCAQISPGSLLAAAKFEETILSRTVLPWSEHCTECAWPTCYTTCDLYSPREDGRCRRFLDGMVRIDCPESVNGYLLKIRFKRWGKLWTPGILQMHSARRARAHEKRDQRIGGLLQLLPLPAPAKRFAAKKRYGLKKRMAVRRSTSVLPTSFVLECINPSVDPVSLTFSIRPLHAQGSVIPFQRRIELASGFSRVRIPYAEIAGVVDTTEAFGVELVPNETSEETILFFGLMDFVEEAGHPVAAANKVKCVVWDLDNTIWDGILVEDGPEKLHLKPGIAQVLDTLDQRGILQSITSKNNGPEAMAALQHFGLADYFLHPQVGWGPKSASVQSIASLLNIGKDALLFVDDSAFERTEVATVCPEVETLDASEYLSLPDAIRCRVPVTKESKARRAMYRTEQERQTYAGTFSHDYEAFLKHCNIEIVLAPLTEANAERVHELTQRTNQMNFSGNRYDRTKLREIQAKPYLDTYVISCTDRFGSYGIVGFGLIDRREPSLTDLMFSCRIQAKRVEHAFLRHVIRSYRNTGSGDFYAAYRKSVRNQPSAKVFEDLGMQEQGTIDGVTTLLLPAHAEVADDDGLIRVTLEPSDAFEESAT